MTEIYPEIPFLSKMLKDLIERSKEGDRKQTWQLQQFTHILLDYSYSNRSHTSDHFGFNNFSKSNHELPHPKTLEAFQFIHEMKANDLFHVIQLNRLYGTDYALKYILQQKFQSNVGKKVTEIKTPLTFRSGF